MKITRKQLRKYISGMLREGSTAEERAAVYHQMMERGRREEKIFADWIKTLYPNAIHHGGKGEPDVTIGNITIDFGMPGKLLWIGSFNDHLQDIPQRYPHLQKRWEIYSSIKKVRKAHAKGRNYFQELDPKDAYKIWANCGYDVAARYYDSGEAYKFMALTNKGYKFLEKLYNHSEIDKSLNNNKPDTPTPLTMSMVTEIKTRQDGWTGLYFDNLDWQNSVKPIRKVFSYDD